MIGAFILFAALGPPPRICIDPGHPSEVGEGTRGRKLSEMHAAWVVANQMAQILRAKGAVVKLTKSSEKQFVRNRDRARIANEFRADLMVRLHCDSRSGSGFAVYSPDRQGEAEGKRGPSKEVIAGSQAVGARFYATIKTQLDGKLKANGFLSDTKTQVGAAHGALIGSVFSEVPVVLVEMASLKNRADEKFLRSKTGRSLLAKALAQAALSATQASRKENWDPTAVEPQHLTRRQ